MPLPRKLIHVAWMAIPLGLLMEIIVLIAEIDLVEERRRRCGQAAIGRS